ncbi:hypothetical protein M011DRAFT_488565 [Sporormia fimetaria CBS 119925]|uniref:Putative gamma-glutamylcyclotransferase n=1 Tax=Sporormia fimetaria CBS 119925 TaxID=1340428 RepID=A0A6A6V6W1_9PLEO|nr:hypothetical protein M011DRAFT_488565 [Sporormia fimetaria CBS 119925]
MDLDLTNYPPPPRSHGDGAFDGIIRRSKPRTERQQEELELTLQMVAEARLRKLFQPCYMFFYGTLMDPEVLQGVLELPARPRISKASLQGYRVKMWGPYPVLVSDPFGGGEVAGTVWEVTSEDHFRRLQAYETGNYMWEPLAIRLENGEIEGNCRTFIWAGNPDSSELREGSFHTQGYPRLSSSDQGPSAAIVHPNPGPDHQAPVPSGDRPSSGTETLE